MGLYVGFIFKVFVLNKEITKNNIAKGAEANKKIPA